MQSGFQCLRFSTKACSCLTASGLVISIFCFSSNHCRLRMIKLYFRESVNQRLDFESLLWLPLRKFSILFVPIEAETQKRDWGESGFTPTSIVKNLALFYAPPLKKAWRCLWLLLKLPLRIEWSKFRRNC